MKPRHESVEVGTAVVNDLEGLEYIKESIEDKELSYVCTSQLRVRRAAMIPRTSLKVYLSGSTFWK